MCCDPAGADRTRVGGDLVEPRPQVVVAVRAAHVEAAVDVVDGTVQGALRALGPVDVHPHGLPVVSRRDVVPRVGGDDSGRREELCDRAVLPDPEDKPPGIVKANEVLTLLARDRLARSVQVDRVDESFDSDARGRPKTPRRAGPDPARGAVEGDRRVRVRAQATGLVERVAALVEGIVIAAREVGGVGPRGFVHPPVAVRRVSEDLGPIRGNDLEGGWRALARTGAGALRRLSRISAVRQGLRLDGVVGA